MKAWVRVMAAEMVRSGLTALLKKSSVQTWVKNGPCFCGTGGSLWEMGL